MVCGKVIRGLKASGEGWEYVRAQIKAWILGLEIMISLTNLYNQLYEISR